MSGTRLVILRGGAPTAAEAAALTVAVLGASRRRDLPTTEPAWRRAARLEAVGHRGFVSADDLAATRGP